MEPLILSFKESPSNDPLDFSPIVYSEKLNLSVLKSNGQPAVKYINVGTQTFTKTTGEGTDSDRHETISPVNFLGTSTGTRTMGETSDADRSDVEKIKALMVTTTLTERVENTDSDR